MINKFIKFFGPIVQILIVIIFVIISLTRDDEFSLIIDNSDLNKKVNTGSGLFVSSAIVEVSEDDILLYDEEKQVIAEENEKNDNKDATATVANDYKVLDTFVGTLTGYGPDCAGCKSGKTSTGYKIAEVIDGVVQPAFTITYNDDEFGEVRILAAAYAKFPKGTIIRVTDFEHYDEAFIGIVIDTGSTMRKAWNAGDVWMDLLFATENDPEIKQFGIDKNVKFEVLRYGF